MVQDILFLIFLELQGDYRSLYSCTLVNKFWCYIAVPILWKYAFGTSHRESRKKLYNVIINHLPSDSLDLLVKNNIILPSQIFSNRLIFEYINFLTCTGWIDELLQLSINKKTMDYTHKRDLLEK
jgi:hypothetical protein